jgi:hypothetical protein
MFQIIGLDVRMQSIVQFFVEQLPLFLILFSFASL